MSRDVQAVARRLKSARRVLFITGAGVSAESGIPTFRGQTAAFTNGLTEDGLPLEEALSGPAFWRNPGRSWKYFFQLELSLRGKEPNAAHRAIAAFQAPGRTICVATQNIDGLHQRAGSEDVVELHGNLLQLVCTDCDFQRELTTFEGLSPLPRCPECHQLVRPAIVLYEESLPGAALQRFECELEKGFDMVFSVGTTSVFPYVVAPFLTAVRSGIPTVEINPEPTSLSEMAAFSFSAPAGAVLGELRQCLQ